MSSRYIDWCGLWVCSLWVAALWGTSSALTHQHCPAACCVLLCVLHRATPCNLPCILGRGGVCRVRARARVASQPQKKVILDLFQLFDLSNVLITVLHWYSY